MNTKKVRNSLLVFFFILGVALILREPILSEIRTREKKQNTPEKQFCRAEIAKIDSVIDIYKDLFKDTNSIRIESFIQKEEIEKIIPCKEKFPTGIQTVDMGFVKEAYPNDSTVVVYSIDLEQMMVYRLFDERIMTTDSVTNNACYIAGKKVSLETFKKHYPYPFGK